MYCAYVCVCLSLCVCVCVCDAPAVLFPASKHTDDRVMNTQAYIICIYECSGRRFGSRIRVKAKLTSVF